MCGACCLLAVCPACRARLARCPDWDVTLTLCRYFTRRPSLRAARAPGRSIAGPHLLELGGPPEIAPQRSLRDPVHFCHLAGFELALGHMPSGGDNILRCHRAAAAAGAALSTRSLQAGHRALDQQLPLELGNAAQDVQYQLAG